MLFALVACSRPPLEAEPAVRAVEGDTIHLRVPGVGEVELTARVVGDGALTVALEDDGTRIRVLIEGTGTARAVLFEGTWSAEGDADAVLWRQGYQSWSWSGVVALGEPALDADGVPLAGGDGDVGSIAYETSGSSWWAGLAGRDGGGAVLLGATGATRTKFYTAFSPTRAWAVYGGRGEALAVGGELELDPLFVGVGDEALWDAWAATVPGRPPTGRPPIGWSDWYAWYGTATEADLRGQLALAAPPLEVFQVDDGWERDWGDWSWANTFPTGDALATDIAARGLVPGLWMAPLYVSRDTAVYAEHPGWWVTDASGAEIAHGEAGGRDLAILDVTDPDAAAWIAGVLATRRAEGWRYFKLDFLFAGAVEGTRDEPLTGAEAYQRAMRLFREALGDDTFVACGAPMLPSVGWADTWRSGPDIAYEMATEPERAFLRAQTRSTAARQFANGVWWWNDADAILVRGWSEAAVDGAIASALVSGGAWFLGDPLDAVDVDALLAPAILDRLGEAIRPEHPLAHVSGLDPTPIVERAIPDDDVPVRWIGPSTEVLLNVGEDAVDAVATGTVLIGDGDGTLAPGEGEVRER